MLQFPSSGNPKRYMAAARCNLDHSYARMRRQYCGSNLQLQLHFVEALVISAPCYGVSFGAYAEACWWSRIRPLVAM